MSTDISSAGVDFDITSFPNLILSVRGLMDDDSTLSPSGKSTSPYSLCFDFLLFFLGGPSSITSSIFDNHEHYRYLSSLSSSFPFVTVSF